jgi:hypothetical protein
MSRESDFTIEEQNILKRIAAGIIPPAPEQDLPGADDEQIFPHYLSNAAEHSELLRSELHDLLKAAGGIATVCKWNTPTFDEWFCEWEDKWPKQTHVFFRRFTPMVMRAYYQDPRVHSAYNRRPGPPYPEGYVIIEGDWSLLDQVRERAPLYRK